MPNEYGTHSLKKKLFMYVCNTLSCFSCILNINKTIYDLLACVSCFLVYQMVMSIFCFSYIHSARIFCAPLMCLCDQISVVSVAASNIPAANQISFLRAFRTLRALRPLRAATRFQGIKVGFLHCLHL